jgi:hypothetical protein
MSIADITLVIFAAFTSASLFAYGRHIPKAMKDQSSTETLSFGTWALLLASNAGAVAYAIEQGEWTLALLFVANVVGCTTILIIAASRRS